VRLEYERARLTEIFDAVDRADVRMVERRQQACFIEARPSIGIGEPHLRQDLDGDVAIERRIAGAIDLAHAAGAEQ